MGTSNLLRRSLVAGAVFLVSSCGSDRGDPSTQAVPRAGEIPYVSSEFEQLRAPVAREIPRAWKSLFSVIPTAAGPAPVKGGGELLIIGSPTSVTRGSSYYWIMGESGPTEQVAVPYGDERTAIETILVEVETQLAASGSADGPKAGDTVTFGLSFLPGVDVDQVHSDLTGHEQLAVVLVRGPAFPGDPAA